MNYRHQRYDDDWEPVEQIIMFDQTPCNYGGHRTWFLCPHCWRRVAVLYGAGKYFWCRHCYCLVCGSQQEDKVHRMMRKTRKIRERLGASDDLTESIRLKPKNIHWKIFERLRKKADYANDLSYLIMGQRLDIDFDDL